MSDNYRVGDEVEATYRGKVVELSGVRWLELKNGLVTITLLDATNVKVIKRALPEVGDLIKPGDYDLPVGTVLKENTGAGPGRRVWVRGTNGWRCASERLGWDGPTTALLTFRVLDIPVLDIPEGDPWA